MAEKPAGKAEHLINLQRELKGKNGKPMYQSAVDIWWNNLRQTAKIEFYEQVTEQEYDAEDTDVVTVGEMLAQALLGNYDEKADGPQKRGQYNLWLQLDKAEQAKKKIPTSDISKKKKDRTMLLLSKFASPLVYGQIYDAVYGNEGEEEDDD